MGLIDGLLRCDCLIQGVSGEYTNFLASSSFDGLFGEMYHEVVETTHEDGVKVYG